VREILARPNRLPIGIDESNFQYQYPNLPEIITAVSSSDPHHLAYGRVGKRRPRGHINATDAAILANASYGIDFASDEHFDFRFTTVPREALPDIKDAEYVCHILAVQRLSECLARGHGFSIGHLEVLVDGENRFVQNGHQPERISVATRREIALANGLQELQAPKIRFECKADEERRLVNKADRISYMLLYEAHISGLDTMLRRHAAKYIPLSSDDIKRIVAKYAVVGNSGRAA